MFVRNTKHTQGVFVCFIMCTFLNLVITKNPYVSVQWYYTLPYSNLY